MEKDWATLKNPAPGALEEARERAHAALQWAAKAAIANLPPAPDDSHTALLWDAEAGRLATQPLPLGVTVSFDVATLEIEVTRDGQAVRRGPAGAWLDEALREAGLKPTSGVKLPYEIPAKSLSVGNEKENLATLARWYAAAADVLADARDRTTAYRPGPGPARLWPHHFDLAVLVAFDAKGDKSIGFGFSPGDEFYAQPYFYISPYPGPKDPKLPALPAGHWHTKEFFGAVATGEELLAKPAPRAAALALIDAAFQAGKGWLHV